MIIFESKGSFKKTEDALLRLSKLDIHAALRNAGQEGVNALAKATPAHSGLAANSWEYEVRSSGGRHSITWKNTDVENGFPVAIMLQYGYGTGTGGYVQGRDYINPAIQPVFDRLASQVWKAVTSA